MTLEQLPLPPEWQRPSAELIDFFDEAEVRTAEFRARPDVSIPAFAPSNLWAAYHALKWVADEGLAGGIRFCEWGSGLGAVTCLASLLGFEARGIETEATLVAAARGLAQDRKIAVAFDCGSYLPPDFERDLGLNPGPDPVAGYSLLDFDLFYAYPWPAEQRLVFSLFESRAPTGSVLISFHGGTDLRVHRRIP